MGPKFGPKGSKSSLKLGFLPFFQICFISFPGIALDDSLEHCPTTSRVKTHEKNFAGPKLGSKLEFCHFLKVASLFFLDIAQDCSLGQCLTSSRSETSENCFMAKIGAEMIFSILMLLSVQLNLLVFSRNITVYYILHLVIRLFMY